MNKIKVKLDIAPELVETDRAIRLKNKFENCETDTVLRLSKEGLSLVSDGQELMGDLKKMLKRVENGKLSHEMLVKAAKIRDDNINSAIDATAGMGEDSFLLAATGFTVHLFERNPIVFELLDDALERAKKDPETNEIAQRMLLKNEDSILAMNVWQEKVSVILLDPMFPERQKSALVKKKLQMIQKIEIPCSDEEELFLAAVKASPKRLIIKRPPKGPHLAGIRPDFSYTGKAVRFDCFANPGERIEKFIKEIEKTTE